jgi:hypothetical protein
MDGGRGERRDREGGRQWKGDLGRVQIKKRGALCCVVCVLVPLVLVGLSTRSWRWRHLFMGTSKCDGLVQFFHSGTRLGRSVLA